MQKHIFFFVLIFFVQCQIVFAQRDSLFFQHQFSNTRWKFSYTLHVDKNEVLFKDDEEYEHQIWFKYDGNSYTFLNGQMITDRWNAQPKEFVLTYNFSKRTNWLVAECNEQILALEYKSKTRNTYRLYFFRLADTSTQYFTYNLGEKPEIQYFKPVVTPKPKDSNETESQAQNKTSLFPAKEIKSAPNGNFMQIELLGGGFLEKENVVLRNLIKIENDGTILRQILTEKEGLKTFKSNMGRAKLEKLMAFIESQSFFEMNAQYNCANFECYNRLKEQPKPVELRLAITYGSVRKLITISIWEGVNHQKHWIDYPKEIDLIINEIYNYCGLIAH